MKLFVLFNKEMFIISQLKICGRLEYTKMICVNLNSFEAKSMHVLNCEFVKVNNGNAPHLVNTQPRE